jgi:hypothetical protein
VRKRKSGVCWSNIVTMSAREGLLASVFCALRERNVSPRSAGCAMKGGAEIVQSVAFGALFLVRVGPNYIGRRVEPFSMFSLEGGVSEGDGLLLCSAGDKGALRRDGDHGGECGKGYETLDGGSCRIR